MKRLIPKAILKWKEPKLIRKVKNEMEQRAQSPWFKPGVVVVWAGLLMLNWWVGKQDPTKAPPSLPYALALAMGGGVFVAYVVPWVYRLCPAYVQVFDHGIARSCGDSGAVWKFKDIDRCEIASVGTGITTQSVLVIHTLNNKRIILGLPPEMVPQLTSVLAQMNVTVNEGAQPTSPPCFEPSPSAAPERELESLVARMKKRIITFLVVGVLIVVLAFTWRSIVFQVILTTSSLKHPDVRDCARQFCDRIVTNDAPTADWLASVDDWSKIGNKTNYFYSLKVHFTECRSRPSDIRRGRIWVFQDTPTNALGEFYYQRSAPCLQMKFLKKTAEDWKIRAIFPLNNCLFDPDVNKDGTVDQVDVQAAKNWNEEHPTR
ncbi:MAG: hypothetical protein PHW08_05980 [Kiritimatiellae bacterium]|nr:hypothetical protein [Kiritimatiellia bacterium]